MKRPADRGRQVSAGATLNASHVHAQNYTNENGWHEEPRVWQIASARLHRQQMSYVREGERSPCVCYKALSRPRRHWGT